MRPPELLLTGGALFQDGNTCAHVAAMHGSVDVIRELLMFNTTMVTSARNETDDATPLHLAAGTGNAEVVRVLLDSGASAEDEDKVECPRRTAEPFICRQICL